MGCVSSVSSGPSLCFPPRDSLVPAVPFPLEFARLASEAFWEKVAEGPALKSVLS